MKLFNGSNVVVQNPKILTPNRLLDFGEGFYTTSSYEQAYRWASRVKSRQKTGQQIINIYEFDRSGAEKNLKILDFDFPDSQWLNFVTVCRSGRNINLTYDIATGPVANDNVYATIQLYETGLLSEAETITRIKVEKVFNQVLFHTEQSLDYLSFIKYENIVDAVNG